MGIVVDLDENLIEIIKDDEYPEQLKNGIVTKSIIEAIKTGKAWTNGDSYIIDDDYHIDEYSIEMPSIQIQACESFFYNPRE